MSQIRLPLMHPGGAVSLQPTSEFTVSFQHEFSEIFECEINTVPQQCMQQQKTNFCLIYDCHLSVFVSKPLVKMYPTTLTQLARSNPFQAPLFSIKPDQQQESRQIKRKLAAAASNGKKLFILYLLNWISCKQN